MHARQSLRETLAEHLRSLPDAPWVAVYETRLPPPRMVWPFLAVYVDGETANTDQITRNGLIERTATLVVSGNLLIPGDHETVEDRMDDLSAAVETRFRIDQLVTALPKLKSFALASTDFEIVLDDKDAPAFASITQTWRLAYYTLEGQPETEL